MKKFCQSRYGLSTKQVIWGWMETNPNVSKIRGIIFQMLITEIFQTFARILKISIYSAGFTYKLSTYSLGPHTLGAFSFKKSFIL